MADELKDLVRKLNEAHGANLNSVVLYGSAVGGGELEEDRPKKVLLYAEVGVVQANE